MESAIKHIRNRSTAKVIWDSILENLKIFYYGEKCMSKTKLPVTYEIEPQHQLEMIGTSKRRKTT